MGTDIMQMLTAAALVIGLTSQQQLLRLMGRKIVRGAVSVDVQR